jgi:protein FAM50
LKNPNVDTSFLPDKERDEAIQREKVLQKQLWMDRQERIKSTFSSRCLVYDQLIMECILDENLKVDFSFFDGTTHPGTFTLKKSQAVREVLEHARRTFQVTFL